MGTILDLLIGMLESIRESQKENKQKTSEPKDTIKGNVKHVSRGRNSVKRNITPLWQERKWKKGDGSYVGFYRTPYGSYDGFITERAPGYCKFYILNVPNCLSKHSHYACFIPQGDSLYEVHFSQRAGNVDEGIMAIEKILTEAHELP